MCSSRNYYYDAAVGWARSQIAGLRERNHRDESSLVSPRCFVGPIPDFGRFESYADSVRSMWLFVTFFVCILFSFSYVR